LSVLPLVVVVDDDESVRESLPDLLRELGFDAVAFASAPEFLASESVSRANVLLCDIAMPQMTGFELLQHMKRSGLLTPFVFITARADATTRSRALAEGGLACLFKPFSPSTLMEALEVAIPKANDRRSLDFEGGP
jgi:FixJ family two-component response regulator